MRKDEWRSLKFRRRERDYAEMSARFSSMTGSAGCAALRHWTDYMDGVVRALERAADDPGTEPGSLGPRLNEMEACIALLNRTLADVRNSCVRYCNAFEEFAPVYPLPRPRHRLGREGLRGRKAVSRREPEGTKECVPSGKGCTGEVS